MIRKLLCAVVVLFFTLSLVSAATLKGKITKIDDKTVTFAESEGKGKFKEEKKYDIAAGCKFFKTVKKEKQEIAVGDIKVGEKGLFATIEVADDGANKGKVTAITVGGGKKPAN